MRTFISSIILFAMLFSCTDEKSNFIVRCNIKSAENQQIYLSRLTLSGRIEVDSALPDKSGTYLLKGYTETPDFFILYFRPEQHINLVIHPGDRITVTGDLPAFDYQYSVEGSKDSRIVQKMVSRQAVTLGKITEISKEYENSKGLPDFALIKARIDSTYDQIVAEHRAFSKGLIEENPGSLASLMALYQQLGMNTTVFDYKEDFSCFEMVDSSLTALYPNSEAVRDLNQKVTEIRKLLRIEIGSTAPEIILSDTAGINVALSSLRGKFVLLYFWASWSPESIRQNMQLKTVYSKYSKQDLEYYQVSLDRTKESWVQSLMQEKPMGIQVSDLKYWDSPVVETYMVEKVPETYLLDREGRIIDKAFTAQEFDQKISGFLKNSTALASN